MSTLNVSNITDGTDTVETGYVLNGSAKAWFNIDGTGTANIRDSLNGSSITDNGVGSYTVTYTSNMSSTLSHVPNANCEESVNGYNRSASVTSSSTAHTDCRFFNTGTNSLIDGDFGYITTHGDLA